MNRHSLRLLNQTSGIMQLLLSSPRDAKNVTPGMLDESSGLTEVAIYPACATQLRRAVILVFLLLGQIDAGWEATQLAYKQLKHTN